jgi:tetratricopeptide (TPR) repeat protein
VNLQHFVLDGAIWKLRDGRIAGVLIRSGPEEADADEGARRHWLRPVVWATGAVCVGVMFTAAWEGYFGLRRASTYGDLDRYEQALERMRRIGRDDPDLRLNLARRLSLHGEDERALVSLGRALELQPSAEVWHAIGSLHAKLGQWEDALAAYEAALALEPRNAPVLHDVGAAWFALERPGKALPPLRRAARLDPEREETRSLLERVRRAVGRSPPEADGGEPRAAPAG